MRTHWTSIIGALLLTGCSSFPVARYTASSENVNQLKANSTKFAVTSVQVPAGIDRDISCRLFASISTTDGRSFSDYIKQGLQDELKQAGAYSESGVPLELNVKSIGLGSFSGQWAFESEVTVNSRTRQVNYTFRYPASFEGASACAAAATSFPSAIQDYLKQVYETISAPKP